MDFAPAGVSADLGAHVERATQSRPGLGCYALLDPSVGDIAWMEAAGAKFGPWWRLYAGKYSGEGLESVSPVLLSVDLQQQECLPQLVDRCNGWPMLSFIVTERPADDLLRHLQQQQEASGPDNATYLLRWADSRSLALLHTVWRPEQRERLLEGIVEWIYPARNGRPVSLHGYPRRDGSPSLQAPFRLDAEQISAITQASQVDQLLVHVAAKPHWYGALQGLPSRRHDVAAAGMREVGVGSSPSACLKAMLSALHAHDLLVPPVPGMPGQA